jgi:hypothetical protein
MGINPMAALFMIASMAATGSAMADCAKLTSVAEKSSQRLGPNLAQTAALATRDELTSKAKSMDEEEVEQQVARPGRKGD